MTINELIKGLKKQEYKIPSFQRKFEWNYAKIVRLFDSIMANYPIYTFLFQRITPARAGQIGTEFYEFSQTVGEHYSPKRVTDIRCSFESVIDGQQRLYALFIGLDGDGYMYGRAINPGHKNNTSKNRSLYLNLLKEGNRDSETYNRSNEETTIYAFAFYDNDDINEINKDEENDEYWFRVSKIKDFYSKKGFNEKKFNELVKSDKKLSKLKSKQLKIVETNLRLLYQRVYVDQDIIKYQELSSDLDEDEILDIFVRVNNGGMKLTFSEFMLTELSKTGGVEDCKGKINKCQQEIKTLIKPHEYNDTKALPFTINEENILKAILCCSAGENSTDIKFNSISNKSKKRIDDINKNLDHILKCILDTYKILEILGFDGKVIPRNSFNILIPIIYYLYHNIEENDLDNFIKHVKRDVYKDFREDVIWYIATTSLSGVFSTSNDTVLWNLLLIGRVKLKEDTKTNHVFVPTSIIKKTLKGENNENLDSKVREWILSKYKKITKAELKKIVDEATYENKNTRLLLLLLYPSRCSGLIDKDHLHPKKLFVKNQNGNVRNKLISQGLTEKDINKYNTLVNLQPCYEHDNRAKNDTPLKDWYTESHLKPDDLLLNKKYYKKWKNNFVELLDIENFKDFIKCREKSIIEILEDKLVIK